MGIKNLDHLYIETTNWDDSVLFWEGLGFSFAEQWGNNGHQAGRLVHGDAVVVLAEVDGDPKMNVFFGVAGIDELVASAPSIATKPHDTHWGTRLVQVTDPDGRTFALEESP